MIFRTLCFILQRMKTEDNHGVSGKVLASLISVVGLSLVWVVVWANLPTKDELWSGQSVVHKIDASTVPELDLTIPGIPSNGQSGMSPLKGVDQSKSTGTTSTSSQTDRFSVPMEGRAKQVVEVKCDAEMQRICPNSLAEDERQQCVARRITQLSSPCQRIVRQRIVRWKEAEGYKLACMDDVRRVCGRVEPGEGRILSCLQEHEQDLSENCYLSLPKGQLLLRN